MVAGKAFKIEVEDLPFFALSLQVVVAHYFVKRKTQRRAATHTRGQRKPVDLYDEGNRSMVVLGV